MDIKAGSAVSIRHYALLKSFKGTVAEADADRLVIKPWKELDPGIISPGDPAVIGRETEDGAVIIGCSITGCDTLAGTILMKPDPVVPEAANRMYERFPVSLYGDIRLMESQKRTHAIIKDISYYGLQFYSRTEFPPGQKFEIDIFLEKGIMTQKVKIVRHVERPYYFEYGALILHSDFYTFNRIKQYVKDFQSDISSRIVKD